MKLPPVSAVPLDPTERRARLGRARRFAESVTGQESVFHVRKTDTKVDVGYWLGKRRVWACLLKQELLLLAWGRRPYVERIPLAKLRESRYNHLTGQLLLAPIERAAVKALKLPPLAALVSPVPFAPIWSSQVRICSTTRCGPRITSRRVVTSASTFSDEPSPPNSLVIDSTASWGSSVRNWITSTAPASSII